MTLHDRLIVKPGKRIDLGKMDAGFTHHWKTKEAGDSITAKHVEHLGALQYLLYAENKRSLLICLQGLDAAGKDGTIRHVLGAVNPQGARVHSFKVPSRLEASHDFLWRAHEAAPAKGEIVAFNRSHYEDVLVDRAHGKMSKRELLRRYDRICEFEQNLVDGGTTILKFCLHLDADEQLRRFHERLVDPVRQWKISESDYAERKFWPEYIKAYSEALSHTSTSFAPWFVIPSNHKWFRNLAVSEIIVRTLRSFGMKTPPCTVDLAEITRKYHSFERAGRKAHKKKA